MSDTETEPKTPEPATAGAAPASEGGVQVGPHGFPEKTPWREMAPEHQAAYWRHHARQKEDDLKAERAKAAEATAKAQQFDALAEASKTDLERERDRLAAELEAARQQQAEAKRTFGAQLVEARLTAAAASKGYEPAALRTLAGDLGRFLADDGVNAEAVDEFLAALPDAASVAPPSALRNPFGAGRQAPTPTSGLEAGRSLYEAKHRKSRSSPA